jgi:hypothetical protein
LQRLSQDEDPVERAWAHQSRGAGSHYPIGARNAAMILDSLTGLSI